MEVPNSKILAMLGITGVTAAGGYALDPNDKLRGAMVGGLAGLGGFTGSYLRPLSAYRRAATDVDPLVYKLLGVGEGVGGAVAAGAAGKGLSSAYREITSDPVSELPGSAYPVINKTANAFQEMASPGVAQWITNPMLSGATTMALHPIDTLNTGWSAVKTGYNIYKGIGKAKDFAGKVENAANTGSKYGFKYGGGIGDWLKTQSNMFKGTNPFAKAGEKAVANNGAMTFSDRLGGSQLPPIGRTSPG